MRAFQKLALRRLLGPSVVLPGALVALVLLAARARADEASAMNGSSDGLLLSASPDAPTTGLAWRGALRGTLGLEVPVVQNAQEGGFNIHIAPLVELHNDRGSTQPLPNENWRGRLAIEASWMSVSDPELARWIAFGAGVEHESDHATARLGAPLTSLQLNDFFARTFGGSRLGKATVTGSLKAQGLVISCTRLDALCEDFRGSASFGAAVDGMVSGGRWLGDFRPFASLHGSWVAPHRSLIEEKRLVIHLGFWERAPTGLWQFFALGFLGNDVGIGRAEEDAQLGIGVRWAP
jgi:hypothetical protein